MRFIQHVYFCKAICCKILLLFLYDKYAHMYLEKSLLMKAYAV